MRKLYPATVASVLLCDPVCMLTCVPTLLYSFIYKRATLRDAINDPLLVARWFVAQDLIVAETFCRCARCSVCIILQYLVLYCFYIAQSFTLQPFHVTATCQPQFCYWARVRMQWPVDAAQAIKLLPAASPLLAAWVWGCVSAVCILR